MKSEYRRFFHDSGSVLIMVIGVIAYSIFYSIPYSNEVLQDVPIAVVDMDNTELSREFTQRLDANDNVEVVRKTVDVNEAQHLFYSNQKDLLKYYRPLNLTLSYKFTLLRSLRNSL